MWYVYTLEYYSANKRNKTVPFAEMWMDPETIIQSEERGKEKNKYYFFFKISYWETRTGMDWETGTGVHVLLHDGAQSLSGVRLLTLQTNGL